MGHFVGLGMFGELGVREISFPRYWFYRLFTDYVVYRGNRRAIEQTLRWKRVNL